MSLLVRSMYGVLQALPRQRVASLTRQVLVFFSLVGRSGGSRSSVTCLLGLYEWDVSCSCIGIGFDTGWVTTKVTPYHHYICAIWVDSTFAVSITQLQVLFVF